MTVEDLLTRTLREVTEHTDYPSTPLAAVQARAGVTRARTRRTSVLAAAAAVALVAGSAALWVTRSPDSSSSPSHELSSGPTSSPTSSPTSVALSSLPQGRPPGIDYLVGSTYVEMGGGRTTSPAFRDATTAALGRGGILVATPRTGSPLSDVWLLAGGRRQALGCGSGRFAITPDRVETAYWLADSCADPGRGGKVYSGAANTMGEAGPAGESFLHSGLVEPVGIVQQDVVVNADPPTGPEVVVMGADRALSALTHAGGADDNHDVVSGELFTNDGRSGVVDAADDSVLWQTDPGWHLGQFSADGRYVLGWRSSSDPTTYAIFDAHTGGRITLLDTLGADLHVLQVAWDGADTVLVVATDGKHEAIVRLDRQGHATLATPIRTVTGSRSGYRLASRP